MLNFRIIKKEEKRQLFIYSNEDTHRAFFKHKCI